MNLADIITRHAAATPFAPAVVEGARTWNYAEFDTAIWRAAGWLRGQGIGPGDVVGLAADTHALHLVAAYALARIGAVQLELSSQEPGHVREAYCRRFAVKSVVKDADLDRAWLEAPGDAPADRSIGAPGGDAGWKIVLTSGTTGAPKAVRQTHDLQIAWCRINQETIPTLPGDRYLAQIRLDFSAGFRLCTYIHWGGGAVVIARGLRTVGDLMQAVEREAITYMALTPVQLHGLLQALPRTSGRWNRVRLVRSGSMAATEALREAVMERLCPSLIVSYGTNDVGLPMACGAAATLRATPGAVGFAASGVRIEIVDDSDFPLSAGETGTVRVRAPVMPERYIDNPEASARAFRDGWYYPGDLGMLTPAGALVLKGRVDDLMNCDGIKIYPSEIEDVLQAHPDVVEVAAFPLPSDRHQHIPAAALVTRRPVDREALQRFCLERLGPRAPRTVVFLDTLPRNAAGKVDKRALVRLVAEHAGRGTGAEPGQAGGR
jgi:acyl-coenzyme A synthetase/AMP-(fatty) acid ligase